jgi:hypothetical protein
MTGTKSLKRLGERSERADFGVALSRLRYFVMEERLQRGPAPIAGEQRFCLSVNNDGLDSDNGTVLLHMPVQAIGLLGLLCFASAERTWSDA